MNKFECTKMPLALFSAWTHRQYNLDEHALNSSVYWEICSSIYGLPSTGRLANLRLRKKLKPEGFYEVAHTPGLWKHRRHPTQFSLIVDDCGVKYVDKDHMGYLIISLQKDYSRIMVDWKGELYAGINLKWNYKEQ